VNRATSANHKFANNHNFLAKRNQQKHHQNFADAPLKFGIKILYRQKKLPKQNVGLVQAEQGQNAVLYFQFFSRKKFGSKKREGKNRKKFCANWCGKRGENLN
jgi:hypothetical protein